MPLSFSLRAVLPVILLFGAACGGAAVLPSARSNPVERTNPNVISALEIQTAAAANAFELVSGLRPRWLYKRGPQSIAGESDIMVYIGSARLGGVPALREIPASTLESLEYLDATRANYRFGRGHPYGAIVVYTAVRNPM